MLTSLSPSTFWVQPLHALILAPLLFSHDVEGVGSIRNITKATFANPAWLLGSIAEMCLSSLALQK